MSEQPTAVEIWIERLKMTDPAIREESIKALEALGDPRALTALGEVFATDPDPGLRARAQSAAKVIYYGAIRRELDDNGASEEERRRAAAILAEARARKAERRRRR